jgi:hypothetical protein
VCGELLISVENSVIRHTHANGVPIQNSKPDVLMMQPFKDWNCGDAADLLGPPKIWNIFL